MSSIFSDMVEQELNRARAKFGKFNSPHEGYAVILEELEELWEWARSQPDIQRDMKENALSECVQIAAMAQRFAEDFRGQQPAAADDQC